MNIFFIDVHIGFVMVLADVFDEIVSKCVYKEGFDCNKAFNIIEESGSFHLAAYII